MANRRPDLERLPYKAPRYLTPMLFPLMGRLVKQGTVYYQDIVADSAAQTGRTSGDAPTAQKLTDQHTTFDLDDDEFIDRINIPAQEIAGLGGLQRAQQKGARVAKRNVATAVEDLTVANILGNASANKRDILDSLLDAVDIARDYVMDRVPGRIALVCSQRIFSRIKRYDAVIERMKFTGVLASGSRDVRSISALQMASVLDLDEVLVGPNSEWYDDDTDYQDRAAIVALPDPMVDPDEEIQIGRTIAFSPLDAEFNDLFQIETFYSDDLRSEVLDAQIFAEQKVFNPEGIYILDGIDEGNSTMTTTTTTTTN